MRRGAEQHAAAPHAREPRSAASSLTPRSRLGRGVVAIVFLSAVIATATYATGALVPATATSAAAREKGRSWAAVVESGANVKAGGARPAGGDTAAPTSDASPEASHSTSPAPSLSASASASPAASAFAAAAGGPPAGPTPNARELPAPTSFPDGYVSALVRAARELGLTDDDIPDIGKRGREQNEQGCPPYIGGILAEADRTRRATLESLGRYTISVITVSYRTPRSLSNAVGRWAASGLLDLVDEKVMFLNAALPEEKALGVAHGFKVLTAEADDLEWLVRRHHDAIFEDAGNEWKKDFPYVQVGEGDGLRALWIAPSLLLALHETASTISVFLEKDYATNPKLSKRDLARQLLAGVAALAADVAVVRLRDLRDPDRWALPNCCSGECGNGYSAFRTKCDWTSHLNWLAMFCQPEEIEQLSQGNVLRCLDERAAPPAARAGAPAPAPAELLCVSFDHSGWSNNAAMFTRHWWLRVLTSGSSLTTDGNGMFEINAMFAPCRAQSRVSNLTGITPGARPPYVCQLWPGMFVHEEIDG